MFQYRQVLVRLRAGDTVREIARSGLMGRDKLGMLRAMAEQQGWLDASADVPGDEAIAAVLEARAGPRASSTISSVEPHRAAVKHWFEAGVQGRAIHAALRREHAYSGSYSAVIRMLHQLRGEQPPEVTVRLSFAPGEAAQVDFGAGPVLTHPDGKPRRTWAFVMTLCHSRHQYVEFVRDQSSATWLGCHRRAFEWFDGVPERVTIDNAKCAIVKACRHDPLVQRAYAECAEGYNFKIDACPPQDPQKKGIVESGVKYVKGNFLPTRTFRDMDDLNVQARRWVMEEAGTRVHGTTRQQPLVLYALERPLLRRLAKLPDVNVGAINHPQSNLADLYRELGDIFAVPLRPHNRWGGFKSLRERWLAHLETTRRRAVLLVDEAQEMSPAALCELRLLASARFDSQPLLCVVLAGDARLIEKLRREELIPLGSRIRTRLATEHASRDELIEGLGHLLAGAGNASLMTPQLRHTLCDHAAGNYRILTTMAAELLAAAAQRDLPQLDEKLYLEVFAKPEAATPRRTASRR